MCHEKPEPLSRFEKFFWRAIAAMILTIMASLTISVAMIPIKLWNQSHV